METCREIQRLVVEQNPQSAFLIECDTSALRQSASGSITVSLHVDVAGLEAREISDVGVTTIPTLQLIHETHRIAGKVLEACDRQRFHSADVEELRALVTNTQPRSPH